MLPLDSMLLNKVPVFKTTITHANVDKLKRIAHAALVVPRGVCYFPAYAPLIASILQDIKLVFGGYTLTPEATKLMDVVERNEQRLSSGWYDPSFTFVTKPRLHQLDSFVALLYNFRYNLSLDPGLGKTKIIIDFLRYMRKPALVVAPSSLLKNWIIEFGIHDNESIKVTIFADDVKVKKGSTAYVEKVKWLQNLKTDVLLVGYKSAEIYGEEIAANFDYDIIVADESHRIKSFKAKTSVAAIELSRKAYRRITMSGTYLLNSPLDAWTQLDFLAPQILGQGYYKFRDTYCEYSKHFRHTVVGFKNMDKLNRLVGKVTKRYTKEDAVDMPGRTVIKLSYELSPEQQKWYTDVLSDDDLLFDDGNIPKSHKVTLLGKLRQISKGYVHLSNKDPQICDGCNWVGDCVDNGVRPYTKQCNVVTKAPTPTIRRLKTNPAVSLLMESLTDTLANENNAAIVWYVGIEEGKILQEAFDSAGYKSVTIEDSTSLMDKVTAFENDKSIRILLSSAAKGIGYSSNRASYTYYFSIGFSLEHYLQSRDRNYRLTTKNHVTEYHIVGTNTLDEPSFNSLSTKIDISTAILQAPRCDICPKKPVCSVTGIKLHAKGCVLHGKIKRKTIDTKTIERNLHDYDCKDESERTTDSECSEELIH